MTLKSVEPATRLTEDDTSSIVHLEETEMKLHNYNARGCRFSFALSVFITCDDIYKIKEKKKRVRAVNVEILAWSLTKNARYKFISFIQVWREGGRERAGERGEREGEEREREREKLTD